MDIFKTILDRLMSGNSSLNKIHLMGALPNKKYVLSGIVLLQTLHGISWKFFPTSHGKGAVDVLCGTVKGEGFGQKLNPEPSILPMLKSLPLR